MNHCPIEKSKSADLIVEDFVEDIDRLLHNVRTTAIKNGEKDIIHFIRNFDMKWYVHNNHFGLKKEMRGR